MVAGDDLHYKILDGLDGLATGVTSIGALILFVLSLLPEVGQPETALMAWVLFSACLAFLFLIFILHRFFGRGRKHILGFMLGFLRLLVAGKSQLRFSFLEFRS